MTQLRWIVSRLWFKIPVMALSSIAAIALMFAWHYGIWSYGDYELYQYMREKCHPVWEDLHMGRIRAGADAEAVIARTNPTQVTRFPGGVLISYHQPEFVNLCMVAKNGKLVHASVLGC